MKKEVILRIAAVALFGAACLFCVYKTDKAVDAVRFVSSAFFPIVIGLAAAFIVNIPMSALERLYVRIRASFKKDKSDKKDSKPNGKKSKLSDSKFTLSENEQRILRSCSIIVTVFLIAGVIAFVLFLVIPQLRDSMSSLGDAAALLPEKLSQHRSDIEEFSPTLAYYIFDYDKSQLAEKIANWAVKGSPIAVNLAFLIIKSAAMLVYYIIAAFIIMVSVLKEKERIMAQTKKFLAAHFNCTKLERVFKELRNISSIFSSFITGQCLEACILGLMFFVSMTILRFPYALVVSSLITVSALIPIFGAFIGLAVGVVLIVIVSPVKAVWFVVLFFVLQQLEGNLIYPRVVGGSVGLPPLWTLLAVIIGGDMFGILGMIFFIPVFSVIYSALSQIANTHKGGKRKIEST